MEKECFKCRKVKPIEEFYKHDRMADGHLNKCKQCTKEDVTANRKANLLYYSEYERSRSNLSHRVKARKEYAQTERGRETHNSANRKYSKEHPEGKLKWIRSNPRKRAVQVLFGNYLRYHRDIHCPCEICGAEKVHAHHENYDEPLKVRWLCPLHHSARHKEMRRLGIKQ